MKPFLQSLCIVIEVALYLMLAAASVHLLVQARWARRKGRIGAPELIGLTTGDLPFVTVQLPLRNEAAVVDDLLRAVVALEWPRDRLQIQVLDDSDDETSAILDALVAELGAQAPFEILRRSDRTAYKAGNLQHGLHHARGELLLVLDADFQPHPDLLFALYGALERSPQLAFVQARWTFRNELQNLLTRVQAGILDALFTVEQARLADHGRAVQFNGTGGLWRKSAIERAGGWIASGQSGLLTEDLDLSLRAQELGLVGRTLAEVVVSTELPADMASFAAQQARWVRGGALALRTFARRLFASFSSSSVIAVIGHLLRHARQPLLVAAALRLPLVAWNFAAPITPSFVGPSIVAVILFSASSYLAAAQRRLGASAIPALWLGPTLAILSMGLAPRLATAFIGGILGRPGDGFSRTQKGGARSKQRFPSMLELTVWAAAVLAAVGFVRAADIAGAAAAMLVAVGTSWVALG